MSISDLHFTFIPARASELFHQVYSYTRNHVSEVYSEPSQTSKVEVFAKIGNGF